MNMGRIVSRMGIVSVCASGLLLSGCLGGAEGEGFEEEVGETEQAMGSQCAGATATASFNGWANWVSAQTYDTPSCFKGVVVDVNSINSVGGVSTVTASWADSAPTTQAACEARYVQMDVYERINGSWSYQLSTGSNGDWNAGPGTCLVPGVYEVLLPGHTYRFSLTARTANSGSAPTRKVRLLTGGIE